MHVVDPSSRDVMLLAQPQVAATRATDSGLPGDRAQGGPALVTQGKTSTTVTTSTCCTQSILCDKSDRTVT